MVAACGGATLGGGSGSGEDGGVSRDGASPHDGRTAVDAGTDCGQPTEPTYSCATAGDAATADGGVCHAYGVDAGASGPTYPFGCTVTLTTCNTSFGGAQTCNCGAFPGNGPAPTWVCPL
jgi:hypothetical protein